MQTILAVENESFKLKINSSDKSRHNFVPRQHSADVSCCRNSFAAFQIIILCDGHACINLGNSPWFSEFYGAENIHVRHKGELTPVMNHIGMLLGDDGELYADMLKSSPVTDAAANVPSGIFVRFEISENVKPGKYSGVFLFYKSVLFGDEELIDKLEYTVNVNSAVLPKPHDGAFELDLWQHNCNIARKAEVENWSDRHFEIIEPYIKTLADIGARTVTAVVSEIPWSGQRCFRDKQTTSNLFEYSMVSVRKDGSGAYSYDYSVLDRYIELCFKYGIDRSIEVFGLINNWISADEGFESFTETPDAIRIRYTLPDGTHSYMRKAKDIEDYITALCSHFKEKGLLDKVRIVADEPEDHATFKKTIEALKRIVPEFRYKAAVMTKPFYDEFKNDIEEFCVNITGIANAYEEWKQVFKNDKSHLFTYYVCCFPPVPNTFLASDLLESRYIAILADYFGFKGFLRWNYTVWPRDPRNDIRCSLWPAGDTNFVYPAGDMSPLLTLRYMALRRGIEDFELLQLMKSKKNAEAVNRVYDIVISDRDFGSFYDGQKSIKRFDAISAARQEEYQRARDIMYLALSENVE